MMNPDRQIRKGVYDALKDALLFNGGTVIVRDQFASDEDTFPRIILMEISSSEDGSKSQFMYESTLTIKISSRFNSNATSNIVDEISTEILKVLKPTPSGPFFSMTDFIIWDITYDGSGHQEYVIKPYKYIDKNIRLNIKTEQNG